MDRSWITLNRLTAGFDTGLNSFIETAMKKRAIRGCMYCPCKRCCNRYRCLPAEVYSHIVIRGLDTVYMNMTTPWVFYGEKFLAGGSNDASTSNEPARNFADDFLFFEQRERPPTDLELYRLTHVQGTGERINEMTATHMTNMEAYIQGQPEEVRSDMYAVAESTVREVIGNMDGHGRAYNTVPGVKAHNVRSTSTSSSSSTARSSRKNKEQELKAMEDSIFTRLEARWNAEFPAAVERRVQAALGTMRYGYPAQV